MYLVSCMSNPILIFVNSNGCAYIYSFTKNNNNNNMLCIYWKDGMSNSVDVDEPCHLDIYHLQKPLLIACGTERVKRSKKTTCR